MTTSRTARSRTNRQNHRSALLAAELRAAIDRGDFPPGSWLPGGQAGIAERYGVCLTTMRRAMRLLNTQGVVDPVRGHGTRIRACCRVQVPATRYTDATNTTGPWQMACQSQGLTGEVDVTDVAWVGADEWIAGQLDVEPGERVVRRRSRMRVEGDRPDRVAQIQDTWLPEWVAAGTPLAEAPRLVGGVYNALIAVGHRPVSADEEVIARMPTMDEAGLFGLGPGSPVLDSRRVAQDREGCAVVFTHAVLDGDRASLWYPQAL